MSNEHVALSLVAAIMSFGFVVVLMAISRERDK